MKFKSFYLTASVIFIPYAVSSVNHNNMNIISSVTIGGTDFVTNSTVGATGTLTLIDDVTSSNITVEKGGMFEINAGARADTTHVLAGGTQSVDGTADNSLIEGTQFVSGEVNKTSVSGTQAVYASGIARETVLFDGGQQYLAGMATDTTVNKNARQQVQYGGIAQNTTVNDGGWQQVHSGGLADVTVINDDGVQTVDAGATATHTTVNTGGIQNVSGTANKTNLTGGGQLVFSGGHATGSVLNHGGTQYVAEKAIVTDTTINIEGQQNLYGTAYNTIVNGGELQSTAGAPDDTTYVFAVQRVWEGGVAYNTTLNGAAQQLMQGSHAEGTIINHGGFQDIAPGASATDTTVNVGSLQNVAGTADKTRVNGGVQTVTGSVLNTILSNGSLQELGGIAKDTIVNKHSRQLVINGGTAHNTIVNDGGWQEVENGGIVNNTTVNAGLLTLWYEASADGNTIINNHGRMSMEPDSRAADVSLIKGTLTAVIPDHIDNHAKNKGAVVDKLAMQDGRVELQTDSAGRYTNLTIGEISGTGNFLFNTSLADRQSNFVTIGKGTGNFGIVVNDSGKEIANHTDLTVNLIHDQGGETNFSMVTANGRNSRVVDGGTYMYILYRGQNKDGLMGGNVWYLGAVPDKPGDNEKPDENEKPGGNDKPDGNEKPGGNDKPGSSGNEKPGKPKTTPATDAILSMATAGLNILRSEMDGLRAYRNNRQHGEGNIWGHYLGKKSSVDTSSGAAYTLHQNGFELGGDMTTDAKTGSLVTGGFVTLSGNKVGHVRGGRSKVDSYGLGAYATWYDIRGFYVDGAVKASRLESNLSARMTNGGKTGGEWHQYGFSSAVEMGYGFSPINDLTVEPFIRVTGTHITSASLALSNGMKAETGKARSLTAEAGARVVSAFTIRSTKVIPYLSAGVEQEFAKSNQTTINGVNRFDNNLDGTSGKYGAGVSVQLTGAAVLYGEVNYRQGSHVEEPVQGVAGIRIAF